MLLGTLVFSPASGAPRDRVTVAIVIAIQAVVNIVVVIIVVVVVGRLATANFVITAPFLSAGRATRKSVVQEQGKRAILFKGLIRKQFFLSAGRPAPRPQRRQSRHARACQWQPRRLPRSLYVYMYICTPVRSWRPRGADGHPLRLRCPTHEMVFHIHMKKVAIHIGIHRSAEDSIGLHRVP